MVVSKPQPKFVQSVYLVLTLFNTLATSFIWGINTLFLLDAGLSNAEAFLANAFFTIGQVIFEIPTGIVADLRGRRTSYILGTLTLAASTLLYLGAWMVHAPFWAWAISSITSSAGATLPVLVSTRLMPSGAGIRIPHRRRATTSQPSLGTP